MKQRLVLVYTSIISAIFLAWISLPFTVRTFNLVEDDTVSKQENRVLASRPVFSIATADTFSILYDRYFNDHIPFRKALANFQTREIRLKLFNRPPDLDGLYVGRDGWLFSGYERKYWEGTNPYTSDDIKSIALVLHKRALEYKARGIKFYIIAPPMKSDIYPEQNPPFFYRIADSVMSDKVAALLEKDTIINFVCGKDVLLRYKDKELLYNITDNHWNHRGAFYAYRALMEMIHKDFPSVIPLDETRISFTDSVISGNMAKQLGLDGYYKEHAPFVKVKNKRAFNGEKTGFVPPPEFKGNTGLEEVYVVADPALPKGLIIRDSYAQYLVPLISENFRKSVFLFDGWYYGPNWETIDKEKPDIVILEIFSAHWIHMYRWK